jgi:hypothetical protein
MKPCSHVCVCDWCDSSWGGCRYVSTFVLAEVLIWCELAVWGYMASGGSNNSARWTCLEARIVIPAVYFACIDLSNYRMQISLKAWDQFQFKMALSPRKVRLCTRKRCSVLWIINSGLMTEIFVFGRRRLFCGAVIMELSVWESVEMNIWL